MTVLSVPSDRLRGPRHRASIAMLVLAGLVAGPPAGCDRAPKPAPKAPPPVPVTVVDVEVRDIPDLRRYPATTGAVQEAMLVARVNGVLESQNFTDGAVVAENELLFVIEQAPYEAQVLVAAGAVRQAEAALEFARIEYERNRPLADSGAISAQELDRYVADVQSATGALESAQAALVQAEIELGYTEVVAPFAGRAGERLVDPGNVVGGGDGPLDLVSIVQLDPMYARFEPAGSEAADYMKAWPATTVPVTVTVRGRSGSTSLDGTLDFVSNAAGGGTSTVSARAIFPNPDGLVIPGLAVDLNVHLGTLEHRSVVPEQAIQLDPQHAFVWVVEKDVLHRQDVTLGPQWNGMRVVEGIGTGAAVVVKGNPLALRTGTAVKPTTQSMDDFLKAAAKAAADATAPTPVGKPSSSKAGGNHPAQSPAAKHGETHSGAGS